MVAFLRIEELEERIAPTVVAAGASVTFTDADGDVVTIAYFGHAGSQADVAKFGGGDIQNGDSIGWITISGGDHTSQLYVSTAGGGNDQIAIHNGVRSTIAGEAIGLVALGVDEDGTLAGTAVLSTGAAVSVNGDLGTLILNGDINFDSGGHSVLAAGSIGLVDILGDMTLTAGSLANIAAGGAGGAGDISFLTVGGDIVVGTGGAALSTIDVVANPVIHDDTGDGTTGTLTVAITGAGATATATVIDVVGGGSVLSRLAVTNAASVAIAGGGVGGDVSEIAAGGATTSFSIGGAADTDVFLIASSAIGTVNNASVGGDIVKVVSDAGVTSIQTGKTGFFGAAYTGAGNSHPLVEYGAVIVDSGSVISGTLGTLAAGAVLDTTLSAGAITQIVVGAGGINNSLITTTAGGIGTVQAAFINASGIDSGAGIASVTVGVHGIGDSRISALTNIGSIQTTGSIVDSLITTQVDTAGAKSGGSIGTISASSILGSEIEAFSGITSIQAKGLISGTDVTTRFTDTVLGHDVGGAIGSISATGITLGSEIFAFGTISSVTIGSQGLAAGSIVDSAASITKVSIKGDMSHETIINASGNLGSVSIGGDFAYDSRIATQGDFSGGLAINGQLIGSDLIVIGNMSKFTVKGGIGGVGTSLLVHGNLGQVSVGGGFQPAGAGGALLQVDGNLGAMSVAGGMTRVVVDVNGSLGAFAAKGNVYTCLFEIAGNLDSMKMQEANTQVTVGGNAGTISLSGDAPSFVAGITGTLGSLSVGGSVTNATFELAGNVGTIAVKGDSSNTAWGFGAEGAAVTVGSFSVGGVFSSSTMDDYGGISNVAVKGGVVSAGVFIRGDVASASIGKGITSSFINIEGAAAKFSVGGDMTESQTIFFDGVSEYAVKGDIVNSNVNTVHYDIDGNPLGGAIGKLTAQDITGSTVNGFGGITSVTAKGEIYASAIESLGRENDGAGVLVGGGSIGSVTAKGLIDSSIMANGGITTVTLGDEGMNANSTIDTVAGNLGSITTKGLIFGAITVNGNVTGSILTAGTDVTLGTGVITGYFHDASGALTGGTLEVSGTVAGTVS